MGILSDVLKGLSLGRVLDVGTGRGDFINIICECFSDYMEITGIDVNESLLDTARENIKSQNVRFISMDAGNMTFQDESFDTVCISNSLHHLPDMDRVLKEMMRVLKPGGLFIVNEMYCDNQNDKQLSHVYIHHFNGEADTLLGVCHRKTLRREEILNIVGSLGVNPVEILDYNTPKEQEEINSEDDKEFLDNAALSLLKKVEQIKGLTEYERLKIEAENIKNYMYKTGFLGATELMVVARKQ